MTSSISFGVASVLRARTLTSNCRLQKPGGIVWLAGIMRVVFGVNTTSLGDALVACPVAHVTPQLLVIVESPSYSTFMPSSVHGMPRVMPLSQSPGSAKSGPPT
ncbi:MAG: hypothetical protein E6J56_07590 [Deltaproteobacteria bacterium]|nr:MAG: hypothetical protein E6J56_07590 [Deltaproteobacteria bacterium]